MIRTGVTPVVCVLAFGSGRVAAQDPPTDQQGQRQKIVVTATRTLESGFESPYSTDSIGAEELRRRGYRTTPQILRDVPGVMVQETAYGHGSPYIRGFTSFRNLFLVDGVRLNNSAFRPGPNQYWNTVDPLSLERLEIVKGPGSVLYGSDAIGGTVNAITKSPYEWADDGLGYGGTGYAKWSSAEDAIVARGEFSFGLTHAGSARTGLLIGGDIKRFDDLEGGAHTGLQPETGYAEKAYDVKVEHWFDDDTRLVFLHQRVRQDDVPRTHRTVFAAPFRGTSTGSDLRREFDQDRALTYLQLHLENRPGFFETLRASVSWHEQDEVRDRVRNNGNQEFQGFEIGTLGVSVQLESPSPIGRLTYGIEWYHDEADSFLRRVQNPTPADAIQGPIGDDATYDLLGVYLQDRIDLDERWQLILGARFNYAAADANEVRDPNTDQQIAIDDDWSDFVGSARLRYALVPDELNLFGGVSQGFRAPNLSDLTRFDSARSNEFEVPATNLDAEEYISFEVGGKLERAGLRAEAAYFYTLIDDQILRFPTGNTNGQGEDEVTKANVGDGFVNGIELAASWHCCPQVTAFGHFTWIEGRVDNFRAANQPAQETYLTRLMPITAQLGVRWEEATSRFWAETIVVRAEDADKLSFSDQRDTSRIPPGGTPSYTLWHLRGGWNIHDSASMQIGLENITDADHRIHGSGLNRPGRSFVIGWETRF